MMKISTIKVSLVFAVLLLVTAFVPIIQVSIMTLNGGLFSLFSNEISIAYYLVNGFLSLLFTVWFIVSKSTVAQIFAGIGFIFFFFPMIWLASENLIPKDPYFLSTLILGALTGLVLIIVDLLRSQRSGNKIV